jgi:hypothetical protein
MKIKKITKDKYIEKITKKSMKIKKLFKKLIMKIIQF